MFHPLAEVEAGGDKGQRLTLTSLPLLEPSLPTLQRLLELGASRTSRGLGSTNFQRQDRLCPTANRKYYGITVSAFPDCSGHFVTLSCRSGSLAPMAIFTPTLPPAGHGFPPTSLSPASVL